MARGHARNPHKFPRRRNNNDDYKESLPSQDVDIESLETRKEKTYSDAYGSGYNYNPHTSALSAQSSYTSMAFYAPSSSSQYGYGYTEEIGYEVDPYGDEFNEGFGGLGKDNSFGEESRAALAAAATTSAWGTKQYSSSAYQPPPPGTTSQFSSYPPRRNLNEGAEMQAELIPSEPSPSYLSTSSLPSEILEDPSEERKLLILDLNGTLLYRAPPRKRDLYARRGERRERERGDKDGGKGPRGQKDKEKEPMEKDEFGRDVPRAQPASFTERDEFGRDVPRGQPASFVEKDEFGRETRPSAPPTPKEEKDAWDPYKDPLYLSTRPLRAVHTRPYIPSFVRYLFHEETRKWLDVMVWSSAQPHSVDDMVARVFGGRDSSKEIEGKGKGKEEGGRDKLIAVWARDTLGLDKSQYHSKSQTTKNLEKPWAELTPLIPGNEESNPSQSVPMLSLLEEKKDEEEREESEVRMALEKGSDDAEGGTAQDATSIGDAKPDEPASTSTPAPAPGPVAAVSTSDSHAEPAASSSQTQTTDTVSTNKNPKRYTHSPLTTLLLDDSPLKARLQPWNHFCVPEYSREVWSRDGRVVPFVPSLTGCEGSGPTNDETMAGPRTDIGTSPDVGESGEEGATTAGGIDAGMETGTTEQLHFNDNTTATDTRIDASSNDTATSSEVNADANAAPETVADVDVDDADIQLQLSLDTSIDTSLVPTQPNSPARNLKKRKRTDTDTGSGSLPSLGPGAGASSQSVPGGEKVEESTEVDDDEIPGLGGPGLGLRFNTLPNANANPNPNALLNTKSQSQLSDMSISTLESTSSAMSVRTVDTEIVDEMGNPLHVSGSLAHLGVGGRRGDGYGGMPPPSRVPARGGRLATSMSSSASYWTSGSIPDLDRIPNNNDAPDKNENQRIPKKYDETILAVVGILDALKLQSNVAGWMRARGVFRSLLEGEGEGDEPSEVGESEEESEEKTGDTNENEKRTETEGAEGKGSEQEYAYESEEQDEEELEKLYERNVIKTLEDSNANANANVNAPLGRSTVVHPVFAGGIASVVGAGKKRERWRKKRRVDNGEGTAAAADSAPTTAPTVVPVFVDVDMSKVGEAETEMKEDIPEARPASDQEVSAMDTDQPTSTTPTSDAPPPPLTAPSSPPLPSSTQDPASQLEPDSTTQPKERENQDSDDEIPGLGQFVFQGNSPPPEGAQIIDVDAMDVSEIAALGQNQTTVDELDPNRWFQYRDVRRYWVKRGKKALKELGIEVEAGVIGEVGAGGQVRAA